VVKREEGLGFETMSIRAFDHMTPTTMTVIVPLDGVIDLTAVHLLLPVRPLDHPDVKANIPGTITAANYEDSRRGQRRSHRTRSSSSKGRWLKRAQRTGKNPSETYFLNSVAVDMCMSQKWVNFKLSRSKIQMCGATSSDFVTEVITLILQHIERLEAMIVTMRQNPEASRALFEWAHHLKDGDDAFVSELEDLQDHLRHRHLEFPEVAAWHKYLAWLRNLETVIVKGPLGINRIDKVMVNYNYDLGFTINRARLCQLINGRSGFVASYNNTCDVYARVELPYAPLPGRRVKKGRTPCHTFIIYRKGTVMQSGPCEELMREPYECFNALIREFRSEIKGPNERRRLRYRAQRPEEPRST